MSWLTTCSSTAYFRIPMRTLVGSCRPQISMTHQLGKATDGLMAEHRPQLQLVRYFGRGKTVQAFGHSPQPRPGPLTTLTMFLVPLVLMMGMIDWAWLKERYGIYNATIYRLFAQEVPRNKKLMLDKQTADMHDDMIQQASKRYIEKERTEAEKVSVAPHDAAKEAGPTQDWIAFIKAKLSLKAEAVQPLSSDMSKAQSGRDDDGSEETHPQSKIGFRNRKIIEYENRIRQYSTPDKIFRYFATYKVTDDKGHVEAMMTPDDFLRSITPGMKQPDNLGLDQFIVLTADGLNKVTSQLGIDAASIFHQLGCGGLISFSDYIFLLTVLSTSRRHFEIAFKMFDLNGDGNVDAKEFEIVTNLMRSQSSTGARHRDHQTTGSTFKGINSGLINYFFGESRDGILTVDTFLQFQRRLQNEILRLEFQRKMRDKCSNESGAAEERIGEKEFAELLIAYAGFSTKKKARMLKRVKRAFNGGEADAAPGITLDEFLSFYQVLYCINDIDTALTFYHMAGAPIERSTMKHVAQTVAGVQLSDHVIDLVFVLFDENGDGKLSNKEFIAVMKQRAMRGLEKPKDTGIGKIFSAVVKCAADARPAIVGGTRKAD